MFVAFDRRVRIHLGVVALGNPPRLRHCLHSLVLHESEHDFVVSCLVNPVTVDGVPVDVEAPDSIPVERPAANLGWAGGLQRLRELSDAELFVWVQDDMTPEPGWLDALVDAAVAHPAVALFGAVGLGLDGRVVLHNGGRAEPAGDVAGWSSTDTTTGSVPDEVTVLDWVTSKGCLVRTAAWDAAGGPDPRLWPLNRVDLDFSTHLRCHGWEVALVPGARVRHAGSQSSPSAFRTFLLGWRDPWFDDRWSAAVESLGGRSSGVVDHPCAEWRRIEVDPVEAASGREASKMVVPLARWHAARSVEQAEAHGSEIARARTQIQTLSRTVADLEARLRRSRRRRRRLKRRLERAEARRLRLRS